MTLNLFDWEHRECPAWNQFDHPRLLASENIDKLLEEDKYAGPCSRGAKKIALLQMCQIHVILSRTSHLYHQISEKIQVNGVLKVDHVVAT